MTLPSASVVVALLSEDGVCNWGALVAEIERGIKRERSAKKQKKNSTSSNPLSTLPPLFLSKTNSTSSRSVPAWAHHGLFRISRCASRCRRRRRDHRSRRGVAGDGERGLCPRCQGWSFFVRLFFFPRWLDSLSSLSLFVSLFSLSLSTSTSASSIMKPTKKTVGRGLCRARGDARKRGRSHPRTRRLLLLLLFLVRWQRREEEKELLERRRRRRRRRVCRRKGRVPTQDRRRVGGALLPLCVLLFLFDENTALASSSSSSSSSFRVFSLNSNPNEPRNAQKNRLRYAPAPAKYAPRLRADGHLLGRDPRKLRE